MEDKNNKNGVNKRRGDGGVLDDHFRSPQQLKGNHNQQQRHLDISGGSVNFYDDTPKIDQSKLAQQGSSEIPPIIMKHKKLGANSNSATTAANNVGAAGKIVAIHRRSAGKKSCKKGVRPQTTVSSQSHANLHQHPLFKRQSSNMMNGRNGESSQNNSIQYFPYSQPHLDDVETAQEQPELDEDEESENILDDSTIEPEIDMSSMIFQKEVPNKPSTYETGSYHINNVRMKPRSIQMISTASHQGYPEEHEDEIGPSTAREIIEKQFEDREEIYSKLIKDKDAVTKEARHSNNVSSLRPNLNSDYFGNTDMDERSNLMRKNETNITKVRNTMAPTTSAQQLSSGGSGINNTSSHRIIGPSKTPTLYETKKHSQPFLNSDHLQSGPMSKLQSGGYATSKATENRSRTAFQKSKYGEYSQTFELKTTGSSVVKSHIYHKMSTNNAITSSEVNYGSAASLLNHPDKQPNSLAAAASYNAMEKRVTHRTSNLTTANTGGSQGTLNANSVRVNNRTPSKVGSTRNSQQSLGRVQVNNASNYPPSQNYNLFKQHNIGGAANPNYSAIIDRQQPLIINKTAEQSTRKSNKIMIEETTQKMDIKDMLYIKPSASIQAINFFKQPQDGMPMKESASMKAQGRNYNLKHTRNNSSLINQSISNLFQTFFGGTKEKLQQEELKNNNTQSNDKSHLYNDTTVKINQQNDEAEDDLESNGYCETEHNAFDNKMHPAKIVEKNWVDSYKLAQLIEQQEKWLDQSALKEMFGGVQLMQQESAFANNVRSNSSHGFKSPKGAASRGSLMMQTYDPLSTQQRPMSSYRVEINTQDCGRDVQSIRQMDCQDHQACFINDQDSQRSHSQGSNRSERFVQQFFKTVKGINDEGDAGLKKPNIIQDRVKQKVAARLEETRKLEQTIASESQQNASEPQQPGSQVFTRIGQQAPNIPAQLMMTQGTDHHLHTQESVLTPVIKLNQYKTKVPIKKNESRVAAITADDGQVAYPYHKITLPLAGIRRQASNNELQNSSMLNKSNDLDPDDFVMSNTSMSLHTQSQVLGLDTDRGNVLKDSGITLQEDSTFIENDTKFLSSKQNIENLNRPLGNPQIFITGGAGDTPLLPRGREPKEMRLSQHDLNHSSNPHHSFHPHQNDFDTHNYSDDNLQLDSDDLPHLNKTSSIVVNEQFRNKDSHNSNNNSNSRVQQRSINFKLVGSSSASGEAIKGARKKSKDSSHHNQSAKAYSEYYQPKQSSQQSHQHTNVISSVQDQLNVKKWRLNNAHVQPPQILKQTSKNNSSTANIQGLNRQIAETNLNNQQQSSSAAGQSTFTSANAAVVASQPASKKKQSYTSTSMVFNHNEGMNSIAQKVDRIKFSGGYQDERQSITSSSISKSHGKQCNKKKSITSNLMHSRDQLRSERKHNFKLLHQSTDNFNSQKSAVSSSMDFGNPSQLMSSSQQSNSKQNVVTLRSKNAGTARNKSNFSSSKLTSNASFQSKSVIPKTPQTSNKLKVLSAKKQKSVCSNSLFEDVPSLTHAFNSKRRSKQITVGSSRHSVNASITFDSNTQKVAKVTSSAANIGGSSHGGNYQSVSNIITRSVGTLKGNSSGSNTNHNGASAMQQTRGSASSIPISLQQAEVNLRDLKQKGRYRNLTNSNQQLL